jgi:hypothetical protein
MPNTGLAKTCAILPFIILQCNLLCGFKSIIPHRLPEFLSSLLNWVPPNSSPQASVSPLGPRWGGEETLACRGGGWRLDTNSVTLHIFTMWALLSVACQSDRLKTGNHRVKWSCKIATKHKARRMYALPSFFSLFNPECNRFFKTHYFKMQRYHSWFL